MSALHEAEEADQEAAERLRVHEWATEHQNPLTAALQRAESAEQRAQTLEEQYVDVLARVDGLEVFITDRLGQPSVCVVKRHGRVLFDGVTRPPSLCSPRYVGHREECDVHGLTWPCPVVLGQQAARALRRDGGEQS